MRKRLIATLREKGIVNEHVLEAMNDLPRHFFMDTAFLQYAYEDAAFQIGAGQTISQPYTVAFQTSLLEVEKGMRILEIGTGSGYQTAVLHRLGCKVFTVERQKLLYERSQVLLKKLGCRAKQFYGDGYKGLPAFAPFDRVLVTCGAPFIPEPLVEQLAPGGIMVVPVGEGTQEMIRIRKEKDGTIIQSTHGKFAFVPMLEDRNP